MIFLHPVAIKPYLKNYMARYCEVHPYLEICTKNRFASFLLISLRHKNQWECRDKQYSIGNNLDHIMISIPEVYERNFGLVISIKHQYWFNKFIQDDFHDKMLSFVVPKMTGKKNEIKPALLRFREIHNITEDDLPLKTLEKMWERNRYRIPQYQLN